MPNHCHNDVYLSGPKDEIDKLLKHVGSDRESPDFDFNTIIPYPKHFARADEKANKIGLIESMRLKIKDGFNSGGYEWCVENWGTKWNAYQVKRRDYCGVCITFQTAWATPMPVIAALHIMFPLVSIRVEWFERGMGHAGGYAFLSRKESEDETEWKSGSLSDEWGTENYKGHRGG